MGALLILDIWEDLTPSVAVRDVLSILHPEISPAWGTLSGGVHELLNKVLVGDVDVDRMDYMLRDRCTAGHGFSGESPHRMMKSWIIDEQGSKCEHLPSFLEARARMFDELYWNQTSGAADAMLQYITRDRSLALPARPSAYAQLDETNFPMWLKYSTYNRGKEIDNLFKWRKLWQLVLESRDVTEVDKFVTTLSGLYEVVVLPNQLRRVYVPGGSNE
jgi:HD superfamily phosphohydrolase